MAISVAFGEKDFGGGHFLVRSGVLRGTTPRGIVLIAVSDRKFYDKELI